jgi:hypothetical protein
MRVIIKGFCKGLKRKYASTDIELRNQRRITTSLTFGGFLLSENHLGANSPGATIIKDFLRDC